MRIFIIALSFSLLLAASTDSPAQKGKIKDDPQLFLEANQAYEKGEYAQAAALYGDILGSGIHSGEIYYNLGNCFTKTGEDGKALVNYRRAERLMPRDGDLKINLQYVLDQRIDKIDTAERPPLAQVFLFWYYWLSLKELFTAFLIAHIALWISSLLLLYTRNDLLRWVRVISLCLFLILCAGTATKFYSQKAVRYGVVITPEATVRSGNDTTHSPLFILHEGAEFRVTKVDRNGWMKASLPDGKTGWVSAEAAEII